MKLTETAFSKAAKRLADADSSSLSQAQEKLSTVLGFANHDAARKALKIRVDAQQAEPQNDVYKGRRWMGLGFNQTLWMLKALCFHFDKHTALRADQDAWRFRAYNLLKVGLSEIFMNGSEPVTGKEIMDGFDLNKMADHYAKLKGMGAVPVTSQGFITYLDFLPGFDAAAIGKRGGQGSTAREQHGHLTSFLFSGLQGLCIVEFAGRGTERVEALFAMSNDPDPERAISLLEEIESEVRFGAETAHTGT